jgi:hypothetical protein
MKEWDCEYLFVSTDDREGSDFFVQHYGEKCIRLDRALSHCFRDGKSLRNPEDLKDMLCEYRVDQECQKVDIEKTSKEYMTEVYLLAQCDCLLASVSGSSKMAYVLNNGKYEHMKVYNKGRIKINKGETQI